MMRSLLRYAAAALPALTVCLAGPANATVISTERSELPSAGTAGTLVILPRADSTLSADFPGRIEESMDLIVRTSPGGSLSLGSNPALSGGGTPDGGSITIQGFFADAGFRAGLTYQWTGNDMPRPTAVAPLPEPGTGLLLAAGLALLAARRRRDPHAAD